MTTLSTQSLFNNPYGDLDYERQDRQYFYNAFQTNVFSIVADYYQDNTPSINFKHVTSALKANARLYELTGQYCHMRDLWSQSKAIRDTWETLDELVVFYAFNNNVFSGSESNSDNDTVSDGFGSESDLPEVGDSDDSGNGSVDNVGLENVEAP